MPSEPTQTLAPGRYPFHGSCHCQNIQYIVYLNLPPTALSGDTSLSSLKEPSIRIRKCNCSSCHKAGIFHVRVVDAPEDFVLLSPLDPYTELRDYTCFEGDLHWLFCGTCGVRCFVVMGEGEVTEREVEVRERVEYGGQVNGGRKEMRKVWKLKKEGYQENATGYLSVNAQTIEPAQLGGDLREWQEKKWVCYIDTLDEVGEHTFDRPHRGGIY